MPNKNKVHVHVHEIHFEAMSRGTFICYVSLFQVGSEQQVASITESYHFIFYFQKSYNVKDFHFCGKITVDISKPRLF